MSSQDQDAVQKRQMLYEPTRTVLTNGYMPSTLQGKIEDSGVTSGKVLQASLASVPQPDMSSIEERKSELTDTNYCASAAAIGDNSAIAAPTHHQKNNSMSEGTLLQISGLHKESIVNNRVSLVDHTSAMQKKYGAKLGSNLQQKTDSEDIMDD